MSFRVLFLLSLVFSGCALFSGVSTYKGSPDCARMEKICKEYDTNPEKRRGLESDTVVSLRRECKEARLTCNGQVQDAMNEEEFKAFKHHEPEFR